MLLDRPSNRNPPPSGKQLLILIGGFVSVIILIIWALINLFTALLVWLIPPKLEAQIGSVLIKEYEKKATKGIVEDTLNALQDRLEEKQQAKDRRDLKVIYLPEKTVNAFAIPGDRIIIFRGLLEKVKSENELMMVLGHEIGHFSNRDHLRGIAQSLSWQIVLSLVFGNNSGLQSLGSLTAAVSQASFSQNQELAADRVGLDLLVGVYGHAGGAVDFFDRLSKDTSPGALSFLSTHPDPAKRVEKLKQIIRNRNIAVEPVKPLPLALEQ